VVPRGIPHSEFLGRVVGPNDARWEDRDRELALAWMRMDRERCSGCGTFQDEWDRDRFAYVAHARVCPGCENLENEKHNLPREGVAGLKSYLLPRQVAELMDIDDEG